MSPTEEPAADLVVVAADEDVKQFLDGVLARGVERRCLRQIHWVIRRDPMCDSGVRQSPLRGVPDLKPGQGKLLVILDHHGCGRDSATAAEIEDEITVKLRQAGFGDDNARCLVLEPELEEALVPVWDRVADVLATKRGMARPTPREILAKLGTRRTDQDPDEAAWHRQLRAQLKECLLALLKLLRLRHQPALYTEFAQAVSLTTLKTGRAGE